MKLLSRHGHFVSPFQAPLCFDVSRPRCQSAPTSPRDPSTPAPIPLDRFLAAAVALATRCKLKRKPRSRSTAVDEPLTILIRDGSSALWRWELERLTTSEASDGDLLQPMACRRASRRTLARMGLRYQALRTKAGNITYARLAQASPQGFTATPDLCCRPANSYSLFRFFSKLIQVATLSSHWDQLRRGLPLDRKSGESTSGLQLAPFGPSNRLQL